ncbi:MAG: O-antigen ligase domain-containing protein [Flavobacterium sp.]|nr:MAG: O-antigen ligase domain-containing protein [Flavobacterium sp.]
MDTLQDPTGSISPIRQYRKAVNNLTRLSLADFMRHPISWVLLSLIAVIFSILIVKYGVLGIALIVVLTLGVPLAYTVVTFPKFGIISLLAGAYLVMFTGKFSPGAPVGIFMDSLEMLLFFGFFLKHKYDKNWSFIKSPITIMVLIWIGYNFFEVLNPVAASRLAWLYTIRTVAIVTLTYFLFMYHISSVAFIRLILKLWIGLSLFAALYTLKQEYFGFTDFEKNWLSDNPSASGLYFIGGHWRKFSIFSDPVALAYNMVISTLLCITLMFGNISFIKKVMLTICCAVFVMAMLYSGTRGAYILIPAGLAIIFILRLNYKTLLLGAITIIVMLFIIKVPTSNTTLIRFQSAFYPSNDASFNVRKVNQKKIQPFIQSHPIGGGLGSTGTWGIRFSPNSYLASFPPDSGFVRVAVETGWIGLALLCMLLFTILKTGISNYFKINNPELKNYCLAMVAIVFALTIGNFPQEALVQYPINIYFYLVIALIHLTYKFDKKPQEENLHHNQLKTWT